MGNRDSQKDVKRRFFKIKRDFQRIVAFLTVIDSDMAKHTRHSCYNLNYHLVFCPKRRYSILVGDIALNCEAIIKQVCVSVNCEIKTLQVMPDHVHLFVSASPSHSPHQIIKRIKGATSNLLRKSYPQLMKMSSLWSSSYYAGSVGHVSEDVVTRYIENQKGV